MEDSENERARSQNHRSSWRGIMNQRNKKSKLSAISLSRQGRGTRNGSESSCWLLSCSRPPPGGPRTRSLLLALPLRRRGVLLLVVLSLLVLFMLIGTAFLMSSNQYRKGMKEQAKQDATGNYPTKLLDRAVMQILRDTDNPQSAIRYHSLLRDLYGTDGFEGPSLSACDHALDLDRRTRTRYRRRHLRHHRRYPAARPAQGQLIDIYVNSSLTSAPRSSSRRRSAHQRPKRTLASPDVATCFSSSAIRTVSPNVRSPAHQGLLQRLPAHDHQRLGQRPIDPHRSTTTIIADNSHRAHRHSTADPAISLSRDGLPTHGWFAIANRCHAGSLARAQSISAGQPSSSTAAPSTAPASATIRSPPPASRGSTPSRRSQSPAHVDHGNLSAEIALTPNSVYFNSAYGRFPQPRPRPISRPASSYGGTATSDTHSTESKLAPASRRAHRAIAAWKYPTFAGLGDTDESYDAADFQNMFLALQTVTPRAQGRVVTTSGTVDVAIVLINASRQLSPPRPRRPAPPFVLSARPRELLVPPAAESRLG